jgi:hypothetical protein
MANAHYSRAYSEDPYDNSQQSKTFPEDASSTELQELGHTKEPVSTVYQAPPQLLRQWVGWSSIVPEASSLIFTILFWSGFSGVEYRCQWLTDLIVLGLAIVTLKDRPQSPWSNKVIQATKLAPSLWPILFAAVLGNAIKCFARWKAERGSRLGVSAASLECWQTTDHTQSLEQLTNSQTFGSTIGTIVALRTFGLYTLCLILLWGLNPLGSQASFRGVYLKERFSDGFRNLTIADSSMLSRGSDLQLGLDSNAAANLVYTTAFAAIESSTQYVNRNSDAFQILIARLGGMKSVSQSTSMDPWGNVKMPNLKLLTGYDAKSPERWVDVPGGELTNYVSLIGVPVSGIPISSTENLTFTLSAPVDNLAVSNQRRLSLIPTSQKISDNSRHPIVLTVDVPGRA